ncbi:MAG: tetratricopeptide repeat protein [Rubrivivax sp.]|nr:tetratricopeptide repeat protein [Rubrivivax sp.]
MPPLSRLLARPAALVATLLLCAGAALADEGAEIRALLARGDGAAALARAESATAAQPRDVALRFLHGVVLMDLQRDVDALAHFTAMTQEYPELPDPYNNIALLHVRAGRLEMARQALDAALRNDPNHRTARSNLGELYLMLAAQAWELASATGPVDVALLRRLEGVRALLAAAPAAGR